MDILTRLDACAECEQAPLAPLLADAAAEIRRLRGLVEMAISDYIKPEIRMEEAAFQGHEHCSNLDGLRADLAEFQAAVNGANNQIQRAP